MPVITRLSTCLLIALVTPALAQDAAPHVLPFPTNAPQAHAVELALGGASGEPLSVRVGAAPSWLRFETPEALAASAGAEASEPAARLVFSVAPSAPVGEVATVELVVIDVAGLERARHAVSLVVEPPAVSLSAPVPNPSPGGAAVAFTADGGPVRVSVIDVLGREVAVLAEGTLAPGAHRVTVPSLASGAYVVRLVTREAAHAERFTIAR